MQFCGDLHLFILPHWYVRVVIALRTKRTTINLTPRGTQDYQSHSARPYKQRKTPTSEHSGVISLRTLILAPPRGDDLYSPHLNSILPSKNKENVAILYSILYSSYVHEWHIQCVFLCTLAKQCRGFLLVCWPIYTNIYLRNLLIYTKKGSHRDRLFSWAAREAWTRGCCSTHRVIFTNLPNPPLIRRGLIGQN